MWKWRKKEPVKDKIIKRFNWGRWWKAINKMWVSVTDTNVHTLSAHLKCQIMSTEMTHVSYHKQCIQAFTLLWPKLIFLWFLFMPPRLPHRGVHLSLWSFFFCEHFAVFHHSCQCSFIVCLCCQHCEAARTFCSLCSFCNTSLKTQT